jgi:hypothetical protein
MISCTSILKGAEFFGAKFRVVLQNPGIVTFEFGVWFVDRIIHHNSRSGAVGGNSLRINEMTITGSTGNNLIPGLSLQSCILVEDIVPVGLGRTEATRDDLVVNTHNGILCNIL